MKKLFFIALVAMTLHVSFQALANEDCDCGIDEDGECLPC